MQERWRTLIWWALVGFVCMLIVSQSIRSNTGKMKNDDSAMKQCLDDAGHEEEALMLCFWLRDAGIIQHTPQLHDIGLRTLSDFSQISPNQVSEILGSDFDSLKGTINNLFNEDSQLIALKERASSDLAVVALFIYALIRYLEVILPETAEWPQSARQAVIQWISGYRALANNVRINFHWSEPCQVGSTVSFTVEFFQTWNDQPYPVSDGDSISITINQGPNRIAAAVQIAEEESNQVKASFTVRKAGQYNINVSIGLIPIKGSPFIKNFIPGPADVSKTLLVRPSPIVVCTVGQDYQLLLEPKDEYGNFCSWGRDPKEVEGFSLECTSVRSNETAKPFVHWHWVELLRRLIVHVTFEEEGIYSARIKLNDSLISKGEFNMIVLSRKDAHLVDSAMSTRSPTYEVKLISLNSEKWSKNKKAYCTVSPKQISLKDYFLGIIPKRLATFRLCPATKFTFDGSSNALESLLIAIEDGSQQKAELVSKDAHLLVASFAHYLLKNIGGSEKFADKEAFFYHEIRKHHAKRPHDKLLLRIDRQEILQSSMRVSRYFGAYEWCKNFEISFVNEQGLDWGGLRREWIELLCVSMFDKRKSGMFTSFSDDTQALVHPNAKMPVNIKIKHYEFAGRIVGKCLYESSQGSTYRQLVKARFTRSFLAQLIGLRVTYRYFERDDPQLYLSKVKFMEENDVTDMELTFTDEEYDENGKLIRTVELVPRGAHISVNNENKFAYLDALAQHRLVNTVKDQVDAFLRGLNELVPDNLLSIFDENELELLMCGTSEYTVSELKANHAAIGTSPEFAKVLSWFWTAVTNFGPEELSRLLQFTTGSSQLPPGGLSQLIPKIQITASPCFGNLPTAHTCFNQICLPDYDTYEQFEKALLLAINEGSEGFGLT